MGLDNIHAYSILKASYFFQIRQGAAGAVPAGLFKLLGNLVPNQDPPRRRERRESYDYAPLAIYVVRLYERGEFIRTLQGSFSAQSAAEFVRCYNRLSRKSDRTAKAEALLWEGA